MVRLVAGAGARGSQRGEHLAVTLGPALLERKSGEHLRASGEFSARFS